MERTENGKSKVLDSTQIDIDKPLYLQVDAKGDDYQFNYSEDGRLYKNLGGTVSDDILSTNVAGRFTGSLIG